MRGSRSLAEERKDRPLPETGQSRRRGSSRGQGGEGKAGEELGGAETMRPESRCGPEAPLA